MRDRLDDLRPAEVALVTFTRPEDTAAYRDHLHLPFAVLSDELRAAYRAFGFGRGPWWRVYGFATFRAYARLLRKGRRIERPRDDTLQLGGDVVVGADGRIVYLYGSRDPDDRPPVDDLVRAVAAVS